MSGKDLAKLSKVQREILFLLAEGFTTPKNIALRRKTTVWAVYKVLKKLKKKGFISGSSIQGYRGYKKNISTPTPPPLKAPKTTSKFKTFIRVHGQEFNIKILYQSNIYKNLIGTIMTLESNTIKLNTNSLEIYINEDFRAETVQRATALSIQYLNRLLRKLENSLNILILKDKSINIKQVSGHYSEVNNELAKEYNKKKLKLKIFSKDDAKLWFTIDESLNLDEAETVHPKSAEEDMKKIRATFNDIRDKPSFLPSEIKNTVKSCVTMIHELASAQLNQTKIIDTLLPKKQKKLKQEKADYFG